MNKTMKRIGGILITPVKWQILIILIIVLTAAFYLFYSRIENHFIFFPQRHFDFRPEEFNLFYRDVYFSAEGNTQLHGWFFPSEKKSMVILLCHGNAGNISHRLDLITRLLETGFQVFIFDYRGYGMSSGTPSEDGIYMDGRAAYDWLVNKEKIDPGEIVLLGRSLGAAVAIDLALKRKARSLIIESAFLSTREMAKNMFLFSLLSPFLPANYNNIEKITRVDLPKLIIHGEEDSIVPFYMGKRLYDAAGEPKFFLNIKGADHNDTYIIEGERYFDALNRFIRDSKI